MMSHTMPLDGSDLAPEFAPYLHDYTRRISVQLHTGEVVRGYVGKTTGWKPCYILLHNTRSRGSHITLSTRDHIIGFRRTKPRK